MKIVAIRVGDKYGPEYETYLQEKLPQHEFIWVREPYDKRVTLQWNKMWAMQMDIDEPICVIDIDILLVNDYNKLFDYPIKKGQFLAIPGWWRDSTKNNYKINGGFFKYYPKECKYIYDKFMKDKFYWQNYYIKNGTTVGPVNGEQYFVEDSVKEKLKLKFLPETWFCKSVKNPSKDWWARMNTLYPGDWLYLDGEYNKEIKIIHEMFGGKYQNLPSRSI